MELPKNFNPKDAESRWQDAWNQRRTYAWDPTRSRDETFVVDTPPPTVSGSLHVGHLFSYSHQDFIVRFQRMRGKNIFFPIGWDDNGLPTERRVQNLYNVKCDAHQPYDPTFKRERGTKGDPLPVSRRNFIELCDTVTKEDEAAFKHLWSRLGLSYDWEQEYATIDEHCRRISQLSFLDLLAKGESYQAERPVMWDVDFQTAIAQAEVEDKERPSAYHYLRFGVEGGEPIVIATTRPELLAACVAVIVNPDDENHKHLIGKTAITPLFHVPVPILGDPKADPEKGTGIVMVCTFGDQTDVEWWRNYNLPLRQIIGRDGCLLPIEFGVAGWESRDPAAANAFYANIKGKYVKAAQKITVELAGQMEGVIDRPAKEITHAVKFFEKGDRPLELVPTRQWYTKIVDKKDALIGQGRKIQWHPDFMSKRYQSWVEGLNQDWCLSRQRYFGVPVPVWYPILPSGLVDYANPILPAANTLPIDPLEDAPPGYTNAQRDQPGGFTGDPDVLDTWATSSLTPQIASKWVLDKDRHTKLFPMDIRPQSHEIIRTWAFYTIVKAYLHENEIPWRNVVISGWILDPDRKKMSKSQGNVVTPEPLIDEFGADSVRYWAARARLGVDTAYDEQVFKVGKKLVTKLFNASKFAIGRFDGVDRALLTPDAITTETDRAVVAELRPLIERATKAFEQFDYAQALSHTEDFFWRTFCDNYLELAKPRTYDEALTPERLSACATLRLVHRTLLRLLAPFIPYITEEVWSWEYAGDAGMHASIHRAPWPATEEFSAIKEPLPPPMKSTSWSATETYECPATSPTWIVAMQLIDAIRRAKADAAVSMAAPVAEVAVTTSAANQTVLQPVLDDIARMLKVERFSWVNKGTPDDAPFNVVCTMGEMPPKA